MLTDVKSSYLKKTETLYLWYVIVQGDQNEN